MKKDTQSLTRLENVPDPMTGTPHPDIRAKEHFLDLSYYSVDDAYRATESDGFEFEVVITFDIPYAHFFGPPNEEAIAGHPLAKHGLHPFSSFEVINSKWIAELCNRNSVHPRHTDKMFTKYRHFIFTFHDSTAEVIATNYSVKIYSNKG